MSRTAPFSLRSCWYIGVRSVSRVAGPLDGGRSLPSLAHALHLPLSRPGFAVMQCHHFAPGRACISRPGVSGSTFTGDTAIARVVSCRPAPITLGAGGALLSYILPYKLLYCLAARACSSLPCPASALAHAGHSRESQALINFLTFT